MTGIGWWLVAAALAVPAYAYVAYPAILALLGRRRRLTREQSRVWDVWPTITIVVPAYNERSAIGETLARLLETDYPPDRRQILVVSDGSTDGTDDIVRSFASRGVELLRLGTRGGKTAAENAATHHIAGQIVVNTDASVAVHRQALKRLVAALNDPEVGIASGRDLSIAGADRGANVVESGYVGYEMWIRGLETRAGGIVGASGCLYAIRAAVHAERVPDGLSRDFAAALIAREHGYRAVSVNEALCFVPRGSSLRREFRRKVRTMARGIQTLQYKRRLLNPFRYGRFSFMLASHKLARWLVPWAGLAGVVGVAVLASQLAWARWALATLGALAVVSGLAWLWPESRRMPRLLAGPAYFSVGVVAGIWAWLRVLGGRPQRTWEPTRRGADDVSSAPRPASAQR